MNIAERLKQDSFQAGNYEARIAVAKAMLNNGFTHDIVKKIAGISELDLSKLVQNNF